MAKVIAPFKIIGTLDDLNFYLDENKENLVRTRGKTGVTREEFMRNPIYTKARNHSREFGRASTKGQSFRALALYFNKRAKDGSYAGRGNKLMLEIIQEDTTNPSGERTFEKGMENPETRDYFLRFEGNRLRPLKKVVKTNWTWDENSNKLTIENFNPETHIDWPDKADNVHLAIAYTNWNFIDNKFETHYSQEVILNKEEETQTIMLTTEKLKNETETETVTMTATETATATATETATVTVTVTATATETSLETATETETVNETSPETATKTATENSIQLCYLFIGFSTQERKKTKELKRANNTVTIIWSK